MTKSLKQRNATSIFLMGIINASMYEYLIFGTELSVEKWLSHIPTVVAVAVVPALNGVLSVRYKEYMVFWMWGGQLPGCRAFSHLAAKDTRINLDIIRKRYGDFPIEPEGQNRFWYKLYSFEKNDPSVQSCHRNYLFTRDFTGILALFMTPLLVLGWVYSKKLEYFVLYAIIMLVQYLVFFIAAIRYGERLVTTAMAVSSAKEV